MDRRRFLTAAFAGTTTALGREAEGDAAPDAAAAGKPVPVRDQVCLFTDHLRGYGYDEAARLLERPSSSRGCSSPAST